MVEESEGNYRRRDDDDDDDDDDVVIIGRGGGIPSSNRPSPPSRTQASAVMPNSSRRVAAARARLAAASSTSRSSSTNANANANATTRDATRDDARRRSVARRGKVTKDEDEARRALAEASAAATRMRERRRRRRRGEGEDADEGNDDDDADDGGDEGETNVGRGGSGNHRDDENIKGDFGGNELGDNYDLSGLRGALVAAADSEAGMGDVVIDPSGPGDEWSRRRREEQQRPQDRRGRPQDGGERAPQDRDASHLRGDDSPEVNDSRTTTTNDRLPSRDDSPEANVDGPGRPPDPDFDAKSYFSRMDEPPSPNGPEKNIIVEVVVHVDANDGRASSGNAPALSSSSGGSPVVRVRRDPPEDPPESGRGCDPRPSLSAAAQSRRGRTGAAGGKGKDVADRKRAGGGGRDAVDARPKGILRNRGTPIPITQFGRPVSPAGDDGRGGDDPSLSSSSSSIEDDSDPDVSERKARALTLVPAAATLAPSNVDGKGGGINDNDSVPADAKSVFTAKSGLRSGKYALLNTQLETKKKHDGDDDSNENEGKGERRIKRGSTNPGSDVDADDDDDDFNYVGTYESYYNDNGSHDDNDDDDDKTIESLSYNTKNVQKRYDRSLTHFLRTTDLGLTQDTVFAQQFLENPSMKAEPHFHHPSPHPPPGVQFNVDENWVCLDDGIKGSHSPIAPQVVDALVAMGFRAATDPMMWTPTAKTRKYMTEKGLRFGDIPIPGPSNEGDGAPGDTASCLLWTGKFPNKHHGHEQPAVRSQGIVNMSPEDLVDLLMDSSRVSEYNKCNIGRDDEVVLSDGTNLDSCPFSGQRKKKLTGVVMRGAKVVDGTAVFDAETDDEMETDDEEEQIFEETFDDDGTLKSSVRVKRGAPRQSRFVGVTKLVRTRNRPPVVRKVLEFFTLLHCRELTDDQGGHGYIIVARGVTPGSINVESGKSKVAHSEILLNVHIIRRLRSSVKGSGRRGASSRGSGRSVCTSGKKASKSDLANRCLVINVHHMKSPMVPLMLAKKVGLSAASNFVMEIRAIG